MRLVILDKEEKPTEGILIKRDSSFLALRLSEGTVRVWHWNHIQQIERIYKGEKLKVNLETMRKGQE